MYRKNLLVLSKDDILNVYPNIALNRKLWDEVCDILEEEFNEGFMDKVKKALDQVLNVEGR